MLVLLAETTVDRCEAIPKESDGEEKEPDTNETDDLSLPTS